MKTVNVKFQSSERVYSYKCYDESVKEGDYAVVATQYGVKVVKVLSVDEEINEIATSSIVQLIDFTEYDARIASEKRKQQLKALMEKRIKEAKELALYRAIAQEDSIMKELLEEYERLN